MADLRAGYSNYVRFELKDEYNPSHVLDEEPGKWDDDELELERHKKYHGVFTKFTNNLEFYGYAKDYIVAAYKRGGINETLRLTKYIQKYKDGEIKWVERYSAIADFATMVIEGNVLKIRFNNNNLTELLKTHESDDFEIERKDSIDGVILPRTKIKKIEIKGRNIVAIGESKVNLNMNTIEVGGVLYQELNIPRVGNKTALTEVITSGSARHSAVSDTDIPEGGFILPGDSASNMFF